MRVKCVASVALASSEALSRASAQAAARQYIEANYGKEYLPAKPNFYASKKGAQDAHEAIRPIDLTRTPESVKKTAR